MQTVPVNSSCPYSYSTNQAKETSKYIRYLRKLIAKMGM